MFKVAGLSLFFRGITLVSKFLFAIFIARYLTLEELGVFGIFNVSITLSILILGFDFHSYSARTLLQVPLEDRGAMVRDQFVFYLGSYIVFLPTLYLLFFFNAISTKYIILFYAVLVFEHLSQEFYRLFIIFSRPITSNIILFLRSGSWVYVIVSAWLLEWDFFYNIEVVFYAWLTGVSASVLLSLILIRRLKFKPFRKTAIDTNYIRTGFFASLFFFAGTVAYRIVEFSDRYLLDYYLGKTEVGIYTFFAGMGNLVEIVVQVTVVMIFYPKLIESFSKDKDKYQQVFLSYKKQLVLVTGVTFIIMGVGIFPVVHYLDKPEFSNNLIVFFLLATSKIVFNFSLIYHTHLYILKRDKAIMWTTCMAAIANILLNLILIPLYGIAGAAWASLFSFTLILVLKYSVYKNMQKSSVV